MPAISASVGRGGRNLPPDVRTIQQLLQNFQSDLIPYRLAAVTGVCDEQTITLIIAFQRNVLRLPNPSGSVEPGSQTWHGLNGVSSPGTARPQSSALQSALDLLQVEAQNFGIRFIQDSQTRLGYLAETQRYASQLMEEVNAGRLTPTAAAQQANELRNEIMAAARLRSSDIGRAQAEALKATGKTLVELQELYAQRLFKRSFAQLAREQQNQVFLEIVRASGRPNLRVSGAATKYGRLGKGLMVVTVAFAVYNVATAEDTGQAVAREGVGLGAGLLGSMAGGAVAGLACGPGAPVCVGVGAFVGGAAFALGADLTFDWLSH